MSGEPTSRTVLLVNARDPEELRVVRVEDGELTDLRWSPRGRTSQVGDLYLGRVARVESGLDAAFVDIGTGRAGFLHVGHVHPALADAEASPGAALARPAPRGAAPVLGLGAVGEGAAGAPEEGAGAGRPTDSDASEAEAPPAASAATDAAPPRRPRIEDVLRPGQRVVVQVLRDAQRAKGATLTTFLSLPGHGLVLVPALGRVALSRKLQDPEERDRLRALLEGLDRGGLGVIARTRAADLTDRRLRREWTRLVRRWERVVAAAEHRAEPGLLLAEEAPAVRAVRELSRGVERVVVDDAETLQRLRESLREAEEEGDGEDGRGLRLEAHTGARPLFEAFAVEDQWQRCFRSRVPLPGGGSLVIQETEALVAIDVNSGAPGATATLEETAFATNLAAAGEVARQVRLRDLGGIVVVDFIDMKEAEHRREVERTLREGLARDRSPLKVGRLGAFGLMTFTRRRLGTGLPRSLELTCPRCGGTGHLPAHRAGALRALRKLRAEPAARSFRVRAHPGVVAWLRGAAAEALAAVEAAGAAVELVEAPELAPGEPVVAADLLAPEGPAR